MSDKNKGDRRGQRVEDAFVKALREHGYLFPETEQELKVLKNRLNKSKIPFPDDLNDPLKIISKGKVTHLKDFESGESREIERNLAQAARDGNGIPSDVQEQMKKDKDLAQKKRDDKRTK